MSLHRWDCALKEGADAGWTFLNHLSCRDVLKVFYFTLFATGSGDQNKCAGPLRPDWEPAVFSLRIQIRGKPGPTVKFRPFIFREAKSVLQTPVLSPLRGDGWAKKVVITPWRRAPCGLGAQRRMLILPCGYVITRHRSVSTITGCQKLSFAPCLTPLRTLTLVRQHGSFAALT